jgi:carboxyl-terminal processing protease
VKNVAEVNNAHESRRNNAESGGNKSHVNSREGKMKKHFVMIAVVLAALISQPLVGSSGFAESSEPARPGGSAVNRVLGLDGQSGYVQVGDSESLHSFTNAITIEVLFKASSFHPDNGNVDSVVRKNVAAGEENFLLRFRTVDGKPAVEMTPGSHIGMLRAPYDFATDKWYHLAGTYDGGAISAFVNGVRINSTRSSGQMYSDNSDLFIGKGDPEFSFGEYFHGVLDEIRIWNVARSQEQIQAAMNTPLTGKEEGLVAYWNFDEGTAKDLSPHSNDGKLDGNATIVESPRPAVEPEKESVQPAVAEPRELTTQERLQVLEALWTRLSEIYPALEYKGIYGREWIEPAEERVGRAKSDEEFYNILLELMATLKDTHTRIISYPGQPRLEAPPVELNRVERKIAVIRAQSDTGLSPGDVIVSVDGRSVEECLVEKMKRVCNSTERGRVREACGQLLRGTPGTTVTIIARGADGETRSVVLRRLPNPEFWREPVISSRQLPDSIGYIRISRWAGDGLVEEFDKALEAFKSTKGIVIDVRGNGGGNGELADLVNGRLTDKPVISSIDFWRKAGSDEYHKDIGWVQPRGPWTYEGRVAVLMDEASMSSCEHFVSGVEAMGNALLVGAPTNGAGGGPTNVQLSDGTRLAISRALGLRVNGIVFEGHGIPPHIEALPTLADLRAGRDAALNIAKDWILSGKDIPSRSQPLPGA